MSANNQQGREMIRTLIPKPIRKRLYPLLYPKSPVLWANWPAAERFIARRITPLTPPVCIISMPRSGSSWVGQILGLSAGALYLREPITQSFLIRAGKDELSFFEFDLNDLPPAYAIAARQTFAGFPAFPGGITQMPRQWNIRTRKQRRIVMKEVNPFMLNGFIQQFGPKIIYLVRHPVAVANSFDRLGWHYSRLTERCLCRETRTKYRNRLPQTHSFWTEHGALQAIIQKQTLAAVGDNSNVKLIQYEQLCANPVASFKELYDFAGLAWDAAVERKILENSCPKTVNPDDFSTQRDAVYEMNKWKNEVPTDNIHQLKEAYLALEPPFYRNDW